MEKPSEKSLAAINKLVDKFTEKTGTVTHKDKEVTEAVKMGLAKHMDDLKKPLCPCRFYPDKEEEVKHRTWICPCADMRVYKYCHCLLFVTEDGLAVTEHLPEEHEGRTIFGDVKDPTPELGRVLRHKSEEREEERKNRPS